MHGYLLADTIFSKMRTVFRGRSPRETVSFEEKIMSKNKYISMFWAKSSNAREKVHENTTKMFTNFSLFAASDVFL